MSRDLDCQYKTAFVLAHKIREALADEKKNESVSGEVEIDGAYFGGYVKPANWKENRRDRRLRENQTGKRRVVVIVRERNGITLPFVFRSEAASISTIGARVNGNAIIHADERFLTKRINRGKLFGRRRLHEPSRELIFKAASGRDWDAPSYFRRLSLLLRLRNGVA